MTSIGYFICTSVVAGNVDVATNKEIIGCFYKDVFA